MDRKFCSSRTKIVDFAEARLQTTTKNLFCLYAPVLYFDSLWEGWAGGGLWCQGGGGGVLIFPSGRTRVSWAGRGAGVES